MWIFGDIIEWASQSLPLASLAFFLIFSIKPFIMFPPSPLLYISAGIIFPFWMAIMVLYVCIATQMTIGFFNGNKLGEKRIRKLLEKKKWTAGFINKEKDSLLPLCFITRVLPFPKDPVSMFYGAMGMPYLRFLIVSLLGLTPHIIPITMAGRHIRNPLSSEFIVPFAVCLFISLTLLIIYKLKTRVRTSVDK